MPNDRLSALASFFFCLDFEQGRRKGSDPFVRPNKPEAID
jgi:hypothetical protein